MIETLSMRFFLENHQHISRIDGPNGIEIVPLFKEPINHSAAAFETKKDTSKHEHNLKLPIAIRSLLSFPALQTSKNRITLYSPPATPMSGLSRFNTSIAKFPPHPSH